MKFQPFAALLFSFMSDFSSASDVIQLGEGGQDYYDQIDEEAIFVKFTEPGCAACKESAPVWEELATAFAENKNIIIAETECTKSNEACTDNDVEEFPSYKYGDIFDVMGNYDGPMDLESLKKFTVEHVKLQCSIEFQHWCNSEELALVDKLRQIPRSEMEKKVEAMNKAEELELDEAEKKVEAAETMLDGSREKLENAQNDDIAKAAQKRIEISEKALEEAEDAFDILMDRAEPLELVLLEELLQDMD